MGNFSRNTFHLLKQYVSVLLQQGVPLIDADWNELDAIRRFELRTVLSNFVGNGVPDNTGFQIEAEDPGKQQDNFKLHSGVCVVDGLIVVSYLATSFKDQWLHIDRGSSAQELSQIMGNVPLIRMPAPPTESSDTYQVTVYLDIWEWEVGENQEEKLFSELSLQAPKQVNPALGIETCVRIRREWAVRVRNGTSMPQPKDSDYQENHSYYALATITRRRNDPKILGKDIVDIRRKYLTVANIKVPIFAQEGGDGEVVDSQKFADLLEWLRTIYRNRLKRKLLFVDAAPSEYDRSIVFFAIQYINQICSTGALQAKTNNLSNTDALQVLTTLVNAQREFLVELERHGNPNDATHTVIVQYRELLNNVDRALQAQSFWGAYFTQREINIWFALSPESIEAAEFLANNKEYLCNDALQRLINKHPSIYQSGGPISTPELRAKCLRDMNVYLLDVVIQACKQYSTQPLEEVLDGAQEILLALGQPITYFVECFQILKELMGADPNLSPEAKALLAGYFDYMCSGIY